MTGGAPLQPGARFPAAGASESLGRWRDQSQPQSLFRLNIFRGSNPRDIMSLKDRISEDMKSAMRARESDRLSALRLLLAAIKQREVDERISDVTPLPSSKRAGARISPTAKNSS
jgi:hypothetical protein